MRRRVRGTALSPEKDLVLLPRRIHIIYFTLPEHA